MESPSRRCLVWSLWSAIIAAIPYCVRNITAPTLPGHMTLSPVCLAVIITALYANSRFANQSKTRDIVVRIGCVMTILLVIVEVYGVWRGSGPLMSTEQVLVNDALSIIELISATLSISGWAVCSDRLGAHSEQYANMASFCIGFIYGAVCRLLSIPAISQIAAIPLPTISVGVVAGLLSYHACAPTHNKAFNPQLFLGGYLLINVTQLLAIGGDPYYGAGNVGGSNVWYLAAIIILLVSCLLGRRYEYLPAHNVDNAAYSASCSLTKRPRAYFQKSGPVQQSRIITICAIVCTSLLLLTKCLAFFLPLQFISFAWSDVWIFGASALLLVLSALLECTSGARNLDHPDAEKRRAESRIQYMTMILLGIACSDIRALPTPHGLSILICLLTLNCSWGALWIVEQGEVPSIRSWLSKCLRTGFGMYLQLHGRALLILPATILLCRSLNILSESMRLFDFSMLVIFCIGVWNLWSCRQRLQLAHASIEVEEAKIVRAFRQYGFGPLQSDVLLDTIHGYSIKEICERRSTTENTVKSYRRRAYRKLGVTNVDELREKLQNT